MSKLERVLLVEDDPDIQTITTMALQNVGGLKVTAASSGVQAIELALKSRPHIILLDVMMPDMDGPTTLRHLKEHPETAGIPVLFITASIQPRQVASYRELGVVDVLAKPFDPMTLADQIKRIYASL